MTFHRFIAGRLCGAGLLLGLAGCALTGGSAVVPSPEGRQATPVPAPTSGADWCAHHASLENPLALAPGLGGTGTPAQPPAHARMPGGMGGTGSPAQAHADAGGRSGEGGIGGTGVVGVVTGFASICVNGVKLDYTPETPVQRDGVAVPLSVLAVGQVVVVQASGGGDWLQAQRIAVLDAAVGPLGRADPVTGRFEVMGQPATALTPADLAGLRTGDWVRVSGHRLADGHIRASRVAVTAAGVARVTGVLARLGADGWRVGDTPVDLGAELWLGRVQAGQELSLAGAWRDGRLHASGLQVQPTRQALGAAHSVLVQGYVHSVQGQQVSVGAASFNIGPVLQAQGGVMAALRPGQPVLVRGRLDARQRLVADRIDVRPEALSRPGAARRNDAVQAPHAAPDAAREGASPASQAAAPGRGVTRGADGQGAGASGTARSASGLRGLGTPGTSGSALGVNGRDAANAGRGRGRGRAGH